MSDPAILPIPIALAQIKATGFRPWYAFAETIADPAIAVNDDPYARGITEGQEIAEAAFALERAQYIALLSAAEALQDEPSDELAVLIAETVERLVSDIVGSVNIDRDALNARARCAADLIAECDAARTVWVHPEDVALFDVDAIGPSVMANPRAARGSIRIDCSAGWIEHGTSLYLEQLRAGLGLEEAEQ